MSEPLISQTSSALFTSQDTMYLWWLADPKSPKLIGDLGLADRNRRVSLTYDTSWLQDGFALSEDLPLVRHELLPPDKDRAAGAVDDARPDRWGERVIRLFEKPGRLSLMEYLYLDGDERSGALGVSQARTSYLPFSTGTMSKVRPSGEAVDAVIGREFAHQILKVFERHEAQKLCEYAAL